MKLITNKKGFSYSPYVLIVTMLLGLVMATHFVKIDNDKAVAIAQEGKITKNALEVEGVKSAARNAILFAAYQASDDVNDPYNLLTGPQSDQIKKEGPEKFMKERILEYLNSVTPLASIGAYDKVDIEYKDKNGKVRTDGFIVRAEGTYLGSPVKVEKFVDSRIFYFYDKGKTAKSTFGGELAKEIECRLGLSYYDSYTGVTHHPCSYSGDKIYCRFESSNPYTEDSWGQPMAYNVPGDILKDADKIVEGIKQAVADLATKTAKKEAFAEEGNSDIAVKFSVDHVDASINAETPQPDPVCCHSIITGSGSSMARVCVDEWKYYDITITIKGKIHVSSLQMIDNAALNEKADYLEVCAKDPMMLKNGEIKPLKYSFEPFDIDYQIDLVYIDDCNPGSGSGITKSSSTWPLIPIGVQPLPKFQDNTDSFQFKDGIDCQWGSTKSTAACETMRDGHKCGGCTAPDNG